MIREAVEAAAAPPGEAASPRWTLKRLAAWVKERFGRAVSREGVRRALKRLGLSWKKAKKLLGRADPERRADLGYGGSVRGKRLWVGSSSPGLSAKVSFYGLYLYNRGQTEIWPYPRADGDYTVEVLTRQRHRLPTQSLKLLWDGASYHRSRQVREHAARLNIELIPLPVYSPDFMPVEALWRWLREDVTDHHCHGSTEELIDRVEAFRQTINTNPWEVADRLWVKDALDPDEEKLRIPK